MGEHDSPPLAPTGPSGDADGPVLHDSTYPGEMALEIETDKYRSAQQLVLSKSDDTDCRAGDLDSTLPFEERPEK